MRLSYIYDTAFFFFFSDFDNIKSNHVGCNVTGELRNVLKKYILLRSGWGFLFNQQMAAEVQCDLRISLHGCL